MLTVLINGSPKLKGSASGMILGDLKKILDGKTEMEEVDFHTNIVNPEAMETLNLAGQEEAVKHVKKMASVEKYQKKSFVDIWIKDKD